MNRRNFLGLAGKIGAAVASLPLINSCKGSTTPEPPPPPPVPVNLEFKVYNHTQGLKANFSKSQVMSGTMVVLNIADLLSQYAISGVDNRRIALRGDNFGTLIQYSKEGSANLTVPRQDTVYNIFLFNSGPNDLYVWLDGLACVGWTQDFKSSIIPVYRKDLDGQTGEERVWGGEPVPEIGGNRGVFDQINQVLKPEWAQFRYGYFDRITQEGIINYGFGNSQGQPFWGMGENVQVNTQLVQTIPDQIGTGLGAIFQRTTGWLSFPAQSDAPSRIQTNGVLHQAGKDVLAYLFVRSPYAVNVPI
ncbi:MAG: hypothetical protein E4G90_05740 [Gemmatimonadales bacterium]|nr:MAG: hypothetical protein E4G90_05740 [Gemmatimonadales bacterium]